MRVPLSARASRFAPLAADTSRPSHSRRSVWLSSTLVSNDPTLSAFNPSSLSSSSFVSPPTARAFAVSKNTPPETVARLVAALAADGVPSAGCLCEAPSAQALARVGWKGKAASVEDGTRPEYLVAVSAYYPTVDGARAVVFQTGMTGRANVSVGREIASGPRKDLRGLDASDAGFEAFMNGRKWGFGDRQKEGAQTIAHLDELDPTSIKQVVTFTADRAQPVLNALSAFPNAATLGLVGSSTPFHSPTHAPFSLFYNGELSSTGAVGIAIVDEAPLGPVKVEYAGMEKVGEPVQVTAAKGNIVLTLDGHNAARLLLNLVQALPATIAAQGKTAAERSQHKETEFYAAVFERRPAEPVNLSLARHVSRIMAGDPSRGAMSVETEDDVAVGSFIVFLSGPASDARPATRVNCRPSRSHLPDSLCLLSEPPSHAPSRSLAQALAVRKAAAAAAAARKRVLGHEVAEPPHPSVLASVACEMPGVFVAGSENGAVVGQGGRVWVCRVEGAKASVEREAKE